MFISCFWGLGATHVLCCCELFVSSSFCRLTWVHIVRKCHQPFGDAFYILRPHHYTQVQHVINIYIKNNRNK